MPIQSPCLGCEERRDDLEGQCANVENERCAKLYCFQQAGFAWDFELAGKCVRCGRESETDYCRECIESARIFAHLPKKLSSMEGKRNAGYRKVVPVGKKESRRFRTYVRRKTGKVELCEYCGEEVRKGEIGLVRYRVKSSYTARVNRFVAHEECAKRDRYNHVRIVEERQAKEQMKAGKKWKELIWETGKEEGGE